MSADRAGAISRFLTGAGWEGAAREPIAGDASSRRYARVRAGAQTAVLMDAPGAAQSNARFIEVAAHLRHRGLSAPRIFASDVSQGLMLLEDFGDASFPELLEKTPSRERALFEAATDVLVDLHAHPAAPGPGFSPDLGPAVLTEQAGLGYDSYLPAVMGCSDPAARREMQRFMAEAFTALPAWTPVLVLRDYHAGNLFWLPERIGAARVGLIDFQDAGLGHPLYDLVSLARDARRIVAPETIAAMQARYTEATGTRPGAAWPLLAVQRNLRILGIFARLACDHGKPGYLDFLPRTWALMSEDLEHKSLTRLKRRLLTDLPRPTPDVITELKGRCPTTPTR